MWATIIAKVLEMLVKLGLKKKAESDTQHKEALEKTVESVNESIKVEKEIRDKQDEIDKPENKSDVEVKPEEAKKPEDVGGLNFDDFNEVK